MRLSFVSGVLGFACVSLSLFAGGTDEREREEVRLVLWHQEQPPHRVERFNAVVDAFNAAQDRISVEVQVGGWDTAYQRVSAAAVAGQAPDLMFVIPDFALTVRELGIAAPVTDLVRELDDRHRFISAAKDPYYDDGEYWAVPLFGME